MQARADRPHRAFQDLGDLVIAHPLAIDKEEGHSNLSRQPGEGGLEVSLGALARGPGLELFNSTATLRLGLFGISQLGLAPTFPEEVHIGVPEDSEEPRAEVCSWLEAGEGLKGAKHGILHEILGIGAVSTHQEPGQAGHGLEVREYRNLKLSPEGVDSHSSSARGRIFSSYLRPPGQVTSGMFATTPGRSIVISPASAAVLTSRSDFRTRAARSSFHVTRLTARSGR